MKKVALVAFVVMLTGCAAASAWTSAQSRCANDPSCLTSVKNYAEVGKAVASPWGPVAASAATSVIMFVGLGLAGLHMKKKEEK